MVQGAQSVSNSVVETGNQSQRRLLGAVHNVNARVRQNAGPTARRYARQINDSSVQLVETLLESSKAMEFQMAMQHRLPEPVMRWASDQIASLRESGMLEEAAARAVKALQSDLQQAASIMPYLEALQEVARKEKQKQATLKRL